MRNFYDSIKLFNINLLEIIMALIRFHFFHLFVGFISLAEIKLNNNKKKEILNVFKRPRSDFPFFSPFYFGCFCFVKLLQVVHWMFQNV